MYHFGKITPHAPNLHKITTKMNAIPVTPYYSNAKYYLAMPRPVFDALEAAYLAGADSAEVSPELYAAFIANLKSAELCPELS